MKVQANQRRYGPNRLVKLEDGQWEARVPETDTSLGVFDNREDAVAALDAHHGEP